MWNLQGTYHGMLEKLDVRSGMSTGGIPGPGTHQVGPETRDPKIFKWDAGPLIFYSFHTLFFTSLDLNNLLFTC